MSHNVYREGRVHVCAEECSTCIFRKGNLMHLEGGRVREMVEGSKASESAIICHQTLDADNAVCRGFFNRYPTAPLQIAERLDLITYIDPKDPSR